MDAVQYITPDFTITVHRDGKVTARVTVEGDWTPEDITNTALGQALGLICAQTCFSAPRIR